jgi:hypothetical protein
MHCITPPDHCRQTRHPAAHGQISDRTEGTWVRLCLRPLAVEFYSAELRVASRWRVRPPCNPLKKGASHTHQAPTLPTHHQPSQLPHTAARHPSLPPPQALTQYDNSTKIVTTTSHTAAHSLGTTTITPAPATPLAEQTLRCLRNCYITARSHRIPTPTHPMHDCDGVPTRTCVIQV